MSRKYLFMVHGIGMHANDWDAKWRTAVLAALKRYAPYSGMSDEELDQEIEFVPIGYDSIFEELRNEWGDAAGMLNDSGVVSNKPLTKAIEWVQDHGTEDSELSQFFWDNVLDVLLWYVFPICRARVIAHVAEQLATGAKAMYSENEGTNTAHVLAHSMGTSVAHDSLVSLRYGEEIHEGAFDSTQHKWRSVFMISNTSRLLRTYTKISDDVDLDEYAPYTSNLKPGSRASAICMRYANVYHRADPITWPRRFAPSGWPFSYFDIETVRYDDLKEVHDLENYLANPKVHLPLLRSVFQRDSLGTGEEIEAAIKEFERDHPHHAADEFAELRGLLNGDHDKKMNARELAAFLIKAFKEFK
ncbi:MAG: hypothetical protein AAF517_02900 [Planctomycetota bacterium]